VRGARTLLIQLLYVMCITYACIRRHIPPSGLGLGFDC
jgi:hypothetical protein